MTDPSFFGVSPRELAVHAGLSLSIAQSALLKSFAGETLDPDELKAWRRTTGTWTAKPRRGGYRELWLTAGRRAGKDTRVLGPTAVSVALDPRYEKNGAPGERFVVLVTAPIVEKTTQLMNTIRGLFDRLGVRYQTRDGWLILDDRPVDVRPVPMTAIAGSSDSAKAVIVTDMAKGQVVEGAKHDATFVATSKAMLLSTGGVFVSASQAWMKDGAHFATTERFWRKTDSDILVARGPTWLFVPEHTEEECRKLAGGDERTFKREYLAEPGHADDALLDVDDIERCIARGVRERPRRPGTFYAAAGDLAWRRDFSAVAIGHKEERRLPDGTMRELLVEDRILVWKPRPGQPLDPERVIGEIASALKAYGVTSIGIDQHHFDLVAARLRYHGIAAEQIKTDLTSQARRVEYFLGKLRAGDALLLDDPEANVELGRMRMKLRSTGTVSYAAPEARGHHDDRCDARFAVFERLRDAITSDGGEVLIDRSMVRCPISGDLDVPVRYLPIRNADGIEVGRHYLPPAKGTPRHDRWCRRELSKGVRSGEAMDWASSRTGVDDPSEEQIRALLSEPFGGEERTPAIVVIAEDPITRAMRTAPRR